MSCVPSSRSYLARRTGLPPQPDGQLWFAPFSLASGSGFVYYLILQDQRRTTIERC